MSEAKFAKRTVLTDVGLIDGNATPRCDGAYVAIRGTTIDEIGDAHGFCARPGDEVLRLPDMLVMPGLIDAHLHLYATGSTEEPPQIRYGDDILPLIAVSNLEAHVEAGFTTVRDTGSENGSIWALRYAAENGMFRSPRIIACGKVLTITGGHGTEYGIDMAWECDDAGDLIKAVRRQHHEGADYIKVIASRHSADGKGSVAAWSAEELTAAVAEAHGRGLKVSAHVMGADAIGVALRAGVDSLEHGWSGNEELWRTTAESGTYLVPTLSVLYQKEAHAASGRPIWPPAFDEIFGTLAERLAECARAHELGVPFTLGTDAANPGVLHGEGARELELMVEAGLTPIEAIAAGTRDAARLCGIGDQTGTIEIGKAADLLVVDGDPSSDVSLLRDPRRIVGVIRSGRFLKGEATLRCLGTPPDPSGGAAR